MPMGTVTAMATAIVVAVTRVNCVEVIHIRREYSAMMIR